MAAAERVMPARLRAHGPAALLFAASLAATIHFCRSMSGTMEMPGGWGMSMIWMPMPGQSGWGAAGMFLAMWLAMMLAMMLPSALPGFLRHGRALWVGTGYFLVWLAIGVPVFLAGAATSAAAMRWPGVSRMVPPLESLAMVLAGLVQLTSWKRAGLRRCRADCAGGEACHLPAAGPGGESRVRAIMCGLRCGASCAACCSGYMLALLALGLMSLPAMGILAVLIALEKLAPRPERIVRLSAGAAFLAGAVMLARWIFPG